MNDFVLYLLVFFKFLYAVLYTDSYVYGVLCSFFTYKDLIPFFVKFIPNKDYEMLKMRLLGVIVNKLLLATTAGSWCSLLNYIISNNHLTNN